MISLKPEQAAAMRKAHLAALFGLTAKAFEATEKLVHLNLEVVRYTLAEAREGATKALGGAAEPQHWVEFHAGINRRLAERLQSYSRQLSDIASASQAGVAQLAQMQCALYPREVQGLVETAAKKRGTAHS